MTANLATDGSDAEAWHRFITTMLMRPHPWAEMPGAILHNLYLELGEQDG